MTSRFFSITSSRLDFDNGECVGTVSGVSFVVNDNGDDGLIKENPEVNIVGIDEVEVIEDKVVVDIPSDEEY